MLRVFVHVNGGQEQVEITAAPGGQQFVSHQSGRKAHLWWAVEPLSQGERAVLEHVVPNFDTLIVGRESVSGWQEVFRGAVVESGYDPQMLSVTALENVRTPPPAPAPVVPVPAAPVPAAPVMVREPVSPPGVRPVAQVHGFFQGAQQAQQAPAEAKTDMGDPVDGRTAQ